LRALRSSLGADERARACGRTEGHATLIVDAQGRLAGACLVGPQASEAAGLLSLALAQRLDTAALAAMPCASSSLAEALARAALTDGARRARAPAVARLLKLGRWLR
jgi:pyruvate/2-oxoglutarate dehydrogenase complex dihydrolipoamide dehydrogenase (E3) component